MVAPSQYFRSVVISAEAAMYHYWLRDRAVYDKFTAIASRQYMTMKELLQLINTLEAQAAMFRRSLIDTELANPANTSRLRRRLPK
jgi:hypothetical protein